jgi:hypothetical protein
MVAAAVMLSWSEMVGIIIVGGSLPAKREI